MNISLIMGLRIIGELRYHDLAKWRICERQAGILREEMTMHTLFHCHPSEFCCSQQETGGIYMDGKFTPIKILCIATHCRYPGKQCLYVKNGGKRPQDGERWQQNR